jgi:hypothetical protein
MRLNPPMQRLRPVSSLGSTMGRCDTLEPVKGMAVECPSLIHYTWSNHMLQRNLLHSLDPCIAESTDPRGIPWAHWHPNQLGWGRLHCACLAWQVL